MHVRSVDDFWVVDTGLDPLLQRCLTLGFLGLLIFQQR